MDEKRITISDIAEELGLSTATVSNVIHGKTKKFLRKLSTGCRSFWKSDSTFPAWQGFY